MVVACVKDIITEVFVNANTALQADPANWYVQNGRQLYSLCGVNSFIVDKLKNTPQYPNGVTLQPFFENYVEYIEVTVAKIIIVTDYDEKDNLTDRYNVTFKPVLYPAFSEFFEALLQHQNIVETDISQVKFSKIDIPGWQPADTQMEQYLDAIEISNLKFKIYIPLNC